MPPKDARKREPNKNGAFQPIGRKRNKQKSLSYKGVVRDVFKAKRFRFLKPVDGIPNIDAGKDVFFHCDRISSGGLELVKNDVVEFSVANKQDEKGPSVFRGVLHEAFKRNALQIKEFLESIESTFSYDSTDQSAASESKLSILSCLVAWRCIADSINSDQILDFLQVISRLESHAQSLKESFKKVLHAIAHSQILRTDQGPFQTLFRRNCSSRENINIVREFFAKLIMHVPEKRRAIVNLIEPLVEESPEASKFCYQLLKAVCCQTATSIEDQNWNEVPLVPTTEELNESEKESLLQLQPIRRKGSYKDAQEYLEILFRLLRADCFHSLKKGIRDLLDNKLDKRDMNVYYDVHVVGINVMRQSKLNLAVSLRTLDKKVDWEKSTKLMFGNLLCLSMSCGFDDVIWTTVASREHLKTKQIVLVELCSELNSLGDSDAIQMLSVFEGRGMAVESPTYYRAYAPILRSLQKQDPECVSFKDELVSLFQHGPPDFINSSATFDQKLILKSGFEFVGESLPVKILTEKRLTGKTIFDSSQEEAITEIFKRRIGIIQGPPGTGKTFIGVKLTQLLLSLSTRPTGPILVLTYKNHALDEFVKALLSAGCDNIARVGGGSKDPVLSSYNLNEIEKGVKKNKTLFQLMNQCREELDEAEVEVIKAFQRLNTGRVFSVDAFLSFVNGKQLYEFLVRCPWPSTSGNKRINVQQKMNFVKEITQHKTHEQLKAEAEVSQPLKEVIQTALDIWIPSKQEVESFDKNMSAVLNWQSPEAAFAFKDREEGEDDSGDEMEVEDILLSRQSALGDGSAKVDLSQFHCFDKDPQGVPLFSWTTKMLENVGSNRVFSSVTDFWKIKGNDRIKLIQYINFENFSKTGQDFTDKLMVYEQKRKASNELRNQHRANVLKTRDIVAMTITGASINIDLLEQLRPRIVVVEEAAELLEAQLIAALGSWTEQLILIGDHKQLRPAVESYILQRDYNMDLSLMERLIENGFKYSTLSKQNRMLPQFARLLMDIYPDLESNLERVRNNKKALCLGKSAYFWSHEYPETAARSFTNEKEADRAIKLALFLVQQGIEPRKITILSAYQGQTGLIRKKLRAVEKKFSKVDEDKDNKIISHTIDNYQGDENDFVIVSLVRSNEKKNAGFLKLLNRRCVAQSRARCGLYFIGNVETFDNSPNWAFLLQEMQKSQRIVYAITLVCPKHPQSRKSAREADDIDLGSFCKIQCGTKLECGHSCERHCQPPHSHEECDKDCNSTCESCRQICSKPCRPIHSHQSCDRSVPKRLPCFHQVLMPCKNDPSTVLCTEHVPFIAANCGHNQTRMCFQNYDDITCTKPCTNQLKCGHLCSRPCGEPCRDDDCSVCRKFRAEEAKMKEEKEKELRKQYEEKIKKRLEEIKKEADKTMTRIEILKTGETAEEYYMVEDRVKNYIMPGHKWYPVVKKIEKVKNYELEERWLKSTRLLKDNELRSDLKFHGTSSEAVEAIIKKGFRMPNKGGMYGKGIYFATNSSKSAQTIYTKGSNMLLLCDVSIGKTMPVDKARSDMTLQKLRAAGFDSLYAKRETRSTGGVLYDEYVIYDKDQALPKYIIHYEHESLMKSIAMPGAARDKLEKYTLKPTRSVDTTDPKDVHYRIAESQFLRLMRKLGKKRLVKSIDFYSNPKLEKAFEDKKKEFEMKYPDSPKYSECIFAFHGTKPGSVEGIMEENFRIDLLSKNTGNPGQYGAGIYFSEIPDTSMHYGDGLILCKVLPGECLDVTGKDMKGKPKQDGCDSHGAHPIDKWFQILVIFDKDQILPCYSIKSEKY